MTDAQILTLVQNAFAEMQAQCESTIWNGSELSSDYFPGVIGRCYIHIFNLYADFYEYLLFRLVTNQ
jgi:hypothetical protein